MERRLALSASLALVAIAALGGRACADGKGFPEAAFPETPKIPLQRAIVAWRDGLETLVVESAVQTRSPQVGWVLPLPAEPKSLEVADAGMLTSLAVCTRPRITHEVGPVWKVPLVLAAFAVPLALVTVFVRDARRRTRILAEVLALVLLVMFILAMMFGTLGTAGGEGASTPGVQVLTTHRVGNYDAAVLRAEDSGALNSWLVENGLKGLDAADRRAIDGYISRKWCFVVATFSKSAETATPHPIRATFPASAPVYPMKLTTLTQSSTRVELYVIADRQAAAEGFKLRLADRFRREAAEPTGPYFVSERFGDLIIGSPDVGELMWDGCVVTALAADLEPGRILGDSRVSLEPLEPRRDHYFSRQGRASIVAAVMASGGVVLLAAIGWVCRGQRRPTVRENIVLWGFFAALCAAVCLVYAYLPIISARTARVLPDPLRMDMLKQQALSLVRSGDLAAPMTPGKLARLPASLLAHLRAGDAVNPFTGAAMRVERSPGNYSLRRQDGREFLCLYDQYGREHRIKLPAPSTRPQSQPSR
jgi:hypothetical protein